MEITLELIVFTVLALFIGVSAILAVTTRRILRAATYLPTVERRKSVCRLSR